jgi:hypothetical protein
MIKFVCPIHTHVELETRVIRQGNGKSDVVGIMPCSVCYESARKDGKQYVYNTITKNLSNMIAEKEKDND